MRLVAAVACAATLLCLGVLPGQAEKRVALVIGNSSYQRVTALPNPAHDAAAMGDLFRRVGFDVVEVKTNLDQATMRKVLRDFSAAVRDADVAVVFYAGHGMEMNGTNYLIPTDAVLDRDIDVEDETVSLDRVSQIIEPARRLRLIILDACRDNPFASGMHRTIASRSVGRGLARVDITTADSMIAFAAKPGSTAADGRDVDSPYTAALLKHLPTPGLDLRLAMGRVRDEVLASTDRKQEPIVFTSLGGAEISLVPGPSGPAARAPTDPAAQAWAVTQDTTSAAVLEDFIHQFGGTPYASMARARLAKVGTIKISGDWFDAQISSSKIHVSQNGNEFSFTGNAVAESGSLIGVGFNVFGKGHIAGNSLDTNWSAKFDNGLSVVGHCSGVSRKDGVIAWRCKDSKAVESSPVWIRE